MQQVDFKNGDLDLIKAALERANYKVVEIGAGVRFWHNTTSLSGSFANGKFTVQEGLDVDAIKVEYSKEAIARAQKRFGWASKQTGENKFRLTRRSF